MDRCFAHSICYCFRHYIQSSIRYRYQTTRGILVLLSTSRVTKHWMIQLVFVQQPEHERFEFVACEVK